MKRVPLTRPDYIGSLVSETVTLSPLLTRNWPAKKVNEWHQSGHRLLHRHYPGTVGASADLTIMGVPA